MENKVLEIINKIREAKNLQPVSELQITDNLREDLELTSFDLAELTVNLEDEYDIDIFEDGLVNTVGEPRPRRSLAPRSTSACWMDMPGEEREFSLPTTRI